MTQRERSKQARRKWQGLIFEQGRSGQNVAKLLPGAPAVPIAFLLVEEATAGGGALGVAPTA